MERRKNVTKTLNVIEDVLIGFGIALSLDQIETLLGIIILATQVVLIIVKGVITIVNKIKEKKYTEVVEEIEKTKTEIEHVTTNSINGTKQS